MDIEQRKEQLELIGEFAKEIIDDNDMETYQSMLDGVSSIIQKQKSFEEGQENYKQNILDKIKRFY